MSIQHCLIIANGEINDYKYMKSVIGDVDYILSADGGARHLSELGLAADIYMGDFDSIEPALLEKIKADKGRMVQYPVRKDVTDSEIAIQHCIQLKPMKITLIGCTGTRLDHTMGNLFLLKMISEAGIVGRILNETNEIMFLDSSIEMTGEIGEIISIVPLSETMSSVSTSGLDYPLNNEQLNFGSTRSISNALSEKKCKVTVGSGYGLVFKSRD